MAFSGLGAVMVSIGKGELGSRPNQVMAGRRLAAGLQRDGIWRIAFSGLGAVVVSIGERGWAAGQSGEGGPAALRLVYSAMGLGVWHSPLLGAVMISGYSVVTGSATV